MSRLRVAMIAPPWLALPIKGYGGIELVLDGLVDGLKKLDVEVVLFANGEHTTRGVKTLSLYKTEQFKDIHRPAYETMPIIGAHLQFALNKIKEDGNFDIIHDHNGFFGPQMLAWASTDPNIPPIVHTHHGPPFSTKAMLSQGLPDNNLFWEQLSMNMGRCYIIGISKALMKPAPKALQSHILPPVYNAIDVSHFPFVEKKRDYFITLARFSRDKGQHIAVKLAAKTKSRLRMAGTVAGIESSRKLLFELANPMSHYRNMDEFRYYSDQILSYTLRHPKITFSGNLKGARKNKFISEAKALLFPIDWEEPFGMAVIEALACGTPVIAMNRGAMPEIIQHGVNGFLADTEQEFLECMGRLDEIDPMACRQSVIDKFSEDVMAQGYLDRYVQAIKLSKKHIDRQRTAATRPVKKIQKTKR